MAWPAQPLAGIAARHRLHDHSVAARRVAGRGLRAEIHPRCARRRSAAEPLARRRDSLSCEPFGSPGPALAVRIMLPERPSNARGNRYVDRYACPTELVAALDGVAHTRPAGASRRVASGLECGGTKRPPIARR